MQELRRQLELGPDPAEVRRAREWVRAQLDGGGGPGPGTPADTVVLLVSELVTNAVVHTGRPAVLRLLLPGEAHTHEEHESPEEPPGERDDRAEDRTAGRRARPAGGHREPPRQSEPARPAGRRAASEEERRGGQRPATGARPGGAGAPGEAPRPAAAPPPETGRPPAGSEAAMVVSLPGLLRLALPDHRPAGAARGAAVGRPDGQHTEERRGARRSAPETTAPDAHPRTAGAGPRADAARSAVVRPGGCADGRETGPAPQAPWVRVGVEPPALSAGVCPLTGRPTLRLEVFDHSSRGPRRRAACRDDTSGRGLELVELLADRWGWRREGRGKQIWCELDLPTCEGGGHGGRRIPARY